MSKYEAMYSLYYVQVGSLARESFNVIQPFDKCTHTISFEVRTVFNDEFT